MTGGVIIAYVALLVIVGLYSARQVRNESDYLVAGRRLGPIVLGATLPATQLSAGTAIGTNATAVTTATRRPNHLMVGLPEGPSRPCFASAYAFDNATTRHLHRGHGPVNA